VVLTPLAEMSVTNRRIERHLSDRAMKLSRMAIVKDCIPKGGMFRQYILFSFVGVDDAKVRRIVRSGSIQRRSQLTNTDHIRRQIARTLLADSIAAAQNRRLSKARK
jgi:hypothetical protein